MRRKFEVRSSKFETNSNSESRIVENSKFGISNLFRVSSFEFRVLVFVMAFLTGVHSAFSQRRQLEQPPPLSPAEGAREAKALVAEMLSAKPEQSATNAGLIKIRDGEGNQKEIPLRIVTLVTSTNWLQIYEASPSAASPATILTIEHTSEKTNKYLLAATANSQPKVLNPRELMVPFAGSDFWIADLGYEFLHWPKQAVIRNEMRHSRACKILESTNPNPGTGGYSRVVCWITVEKPQAPVHADAYDATGRFKQFDPKNLEKVNGVYQVESVEMRNSRAGSHTVLEFDRGE
jgi:Outer membrane lipoprotein-sorting protein